MHRSSRLFSLLALSLMTASACSRPAATASTETAAPATANSAAASASTAPASTTVMTPAIDCEHPFGLADGMQLVYQVTDAGNNPVGEIRDRVVSLTTSTTKKGHQRVAVLLKSGEYDGKNQLIRQQDLTFTCQGDTAFTDGMMEMEFDNFKSFRDRIFTHDPTPIAWPQQPQAGTSLPAGGVVTDVRSSAVDIAKVYTNVHNRRVVSGPTNVTTPAGTFACYKVESEREAAVKPKPDIVKKTITYVADYYAPGFGVVRTEVFDKNHKLLKTRVLTQRTSR